MGARLVVGTIRQRQGDRHLVALPDGRTVSVTFEGGEAPLIGGDVVALVDPDEPDARVRLVPDVARLILSGRASIAVGGDAGLTATMLAMMTRGTGLGAITPGTGGIIERTPDSRDPDLAWALRQLGPEALELGLGLNVLDPLSLARADWDTAALRNERLPADSVGERGALADLRRLMAEGFTPACRRTLFGMSRTAKVPSVDFILPFSPFATGTSFSCDMAGAYRGEAAREPLSGSDARRFSAYRQIAKAFAPRYLGKTKAGPAAGHMEEAFADAAAAIALLNHDPTSDAVRRVARLREAGIVRSGTRDASRAPATHGVLATVLSLSGYLKAPDAPTAMTLAASLARNHAPRNEADLAALVEGASLGDALIDVAATRAVERRALCEAYRVDCEDVATRLENDPRGLDRMARLATFMVPLGLEDTFDRVLEEAGAPAHEIDGDEMGLSLGPDPWAMPAP